MTSIAPHHAPLNNAYFVSLDEIEPNPFQPRKTFDESALQELADSIKADGVLQPILLRPIPETDLRHKSKRKNGLNYQIVFGERRWRASRLAGRPQIPATIRDDIDDIKSRELALDENLKDESLTDYEEAVALRDLWTAYEESEGITISQNQMARRRHTSVTFIKNRKDLLLTRPDVQELAQRHRNVISSCLLINPVSDELIRSELIKAVDNGASFQKTKEMKERLEADAAWKRDSQRAPDKYTRQVQSRAGEREVEALKQARNELAEAKRHLVNAGAWIDNLPKSIRDKEIVPLITQLKIETDRLNSLE